MLAPWYLGHVIEYAGRRPTVVDNFGDDLGEESFAFAERYYLASEPEVGFELDRRRIRYVVAQRFPNFLTGTPQPRSLFRAMYVRDGALRRGDDGAPLLPALERHRLVFESLGRDFRDPSAPPVYKLFEVVAGADVSGRAPPGTPVSAALHVTTNRGRRFLYDTQVVADAEGRYRVRLPYATSGSPPAPKTAPFYRLSCGDEAKGLMVGEQDVQAGGAVAGPDLCLGEAGRGGAAGGQEAS